MDPREAQRFLVFSRRHLYYSTSFLPLFLCVMCCVWYVSVYVYVNLYVYICVSVHVEATAWQECLLSWSTLFSETASLTEPWNHRLSTVTYYHWHLLESACLDQLHVLALEMGIASVGFYVNSETLNSGYHAWTLLWPRPLIIEEALSLLGHHPSPV